MSDIFSTTIHRSIVGTDIPGQKRKVFEVIQIEDKATGKILRTLKIKR